MLVEVDDNVPFHNVIHDAPPLIGDRPRRSDSLFRHRIHHRRHRRLYPMSAAGPPGRDRSRPTHGVPRGRRTAGPEGPDRTAVSPVRSQLSFFSADVASACSAWTSTATWNWTAAAPECSSKYR